MINATVLSGNEFQYTNKQSGEIRTGFTLWFTLDGCPYSFKMGFFGSDQIAKARAALEAKSAWFDFQPDRNAAPQLMLVK